MEKHEIVLAYITPYKALLQIIESMKLDLYVLEHEHTGLKAIRYDKEMASSHNPTAAEELKLEQLEAISELEKKIQAKERQLITIEHILEQLSEETREIVLGVYCCYPKKRTYDYYSHRYHRSINALRNSCIKELGLVRIP